jgi:hypothetical protein
MKVLLLLCVLLFVVNAEVGFEPLPIHLLKLPKDFKIEVLARVPNARQMALSPKGIIFVGSFQGAQGTVTALIPLGQGKYETVSVRSHLNSL